MAVVTHWYIGDKCHSIKSSVTVNWAIICVYIVTFLDWDGFWRKCIWISLVERQLSTPFPHQKFVWFPREVGRGRGEGEGTCRKWLPSIRPGNICRLKSWYSFSSSPVLFYFLFVNLSWEQLNCKAGFASSLDIGISSTSYAESYRMVSVLFLAVCLATQLEEGGGVQSGRPEA